MAKTLTLLGRVKFGVGCGLALAVLFSLIATLVRSNLSGAGFQSQLGISYGRGVALYFLTLPIAGALGGVLGGLLRWAWGAFLVGFLCALIPFTAAALVMDLGASPRTQALQVAFVASALIGGGGFVIGWFRTPHRHTQGEKTSD